MSRLRAETMPSDTEPPRPKGLPIAITHSPMRNVSLSPKGTVGSGLSGFTRSTARSVLGSRPFSSAFRVEPSCRRISMDSAPSTTWLLVTTTPEESMMKPEPMELTVRSPPPSPWRFLKKSSKKSLKGESSGSCGMSGMGPPATLLSTEISTTAGSSLSARSATLGSACACACATGARAGNAVPVTTSAGSATAASKRAKEPCRFMFISQRAPT
jgi:hypothetical protein